MHLQIKDFIEASSTDMALVRLPTMNPQVTSQVVVLTELPIAFVTFVWHTSSVCGSHVALQLVAITELHLTDATAAALLVVQLHVVVEIPDLGEFPATDLALIYLHHLALLV